MARKQKKPSLDPNAAFRTDGGTKMTPYGVPRVKGVSICYPDLHEIRLYGRKSSAGSVAGPGGQIRSSIRSRDKRAARRIWKKRERAQVRQELHYFYA